MSAAFALFGLDMSGPAPRAVENDPLFDNSNTSLSPTGKVPYTTGNTWKNPNGDRDDYRRNTASLTDLQKHVAFFDGDCDGVIWPYDTFFGFGTLGFGLVISALAVAIIHGPFSYPTLPTTGKKLTDWLPDPFMRIYVANIQRCKHGSDTENYDRRGHFQPNKFEEMLNSYSSRHMKDSLSFKDALVMVVERRDLMDFFGVFAFLFEWLSTYMLLWPSDGYMKRDDMLSVLDGSAFPVIAHRYRSQRRGGAFDSKKMI